MIILIGDSWGVCEWDRRYNISGPGIGTYLLKCEPVLNLSRGASSNTQSLDRLENFLTRYTPDNHDTFIWIVTGPNRCIYDIDVFLDQTTNLNNGLRELLIKSLCRANSLANQYKIKIKLVGGVCDLNDVDNMQFTNLEIAVPSWCSLLTDNYPFSIIESTFTLDIGPIIKKKFPQHFNEWILLSELALAKDRKWNQMKFTYFKTDGTHPDRNGHLVLLRTLFPNFSECFKDYDNTN